MGDRSAAHPSTEPWPTTPSVTFTRAGASREVIEHHARVHPCGRHLTREVWCPCGTTLALVCAVHDALVFGVVVPGTWCAHAVELLGPEPGAVA